LGGRWGRDTSFVTATLSTVTSSSAAFGRWAFVIGQPRRSGGVGAVPAHVVCGLPDRSVLRRRDRRMVSAAAKVCRRSAYHAPYGAWPGGHTGAICRQETK